MRRLILALVVGLVAIAASAGSALAGDPVQSSTQSSATGQAAIAGSSATQIQPSNQNISVRVLSPGDDGNVYQSNNADSSAHASNNASTTQNASQTLGGGCGCATATPSSGNIGDVMGTAMQAAGQADPQTQAAPAAASQQSNAAPSTGDASNAAPATQTDTQSAPSGGSGVQSAVQGSSTDQGAVAASSAKQVDPSNSNISVRVLSPGDDGNVYQSNDASSHADASNSATTTQGATQSGGSGGVQSSIQGAATKQGALGLSSAEQIDPSNSNTSVRVLSPGDAGKVVQSNDVDSSAKATNSAPTTQTATQTQSGPSCGCSSHGDGGPDVQSSDQSSFILQGAVAASSAKQIGASNSNDPVRIGSYGNDGSVYQSNDASSHADASNSAPVKQTATQDPSGGSDHSSCGCSSPSSVQAIGQESFIGQLGIAASSATQIGASNSSDPVRIGSAGNGGSLYQSNDVSSHADTDNRAPVTQTGTQTQSGGSCGCSHGPAVQALGQESFVGQLGFADSSAKQIGATNSSDPVRIASYGNDGYTVQKNDAHSSADADNSAPVNQTGTQTQSGSGIQALGQESKIGQAAFALSSAEQLPGKSECGCGGSGFGNSSDPVRIASGGNDGFLYQSNDASSRADASNYAAPTQTGKQTQSGSSCGCGGLGVQALGQSSKVDQLAVALSDALQIGAHNSSSPVRIKSYGGNGNTYQTNGAFSHGDSSNVGRILQNGQQLLV